MKIIIYIGHHKVGSTALQVFLSQNWLRLARAGILYPGVEASSLSHGLAQALGRSQGQDDGPGGPGPSGNGMNIRERHSALAYQMIAKVNGRNVPPQFKRLPGVAQMLLALRKQVEFLKPETVILCSEVFANFGQVDHDLIPQLLAPLLNANPDSEVEIYCALRRPDEYLISWHGQRLKVGEQLPPLDNGGLEPYFNTIHFNFRTVVEAWDKQLPDARLIIRPYSEILKSGGSIDDFLAQTSVEYPPDLTPVGHANQSLPRAAMEIVRRANHDLSNNLAHGLSQYFLNAGASLEITPNKQVEMLSAPVRQNLADHFAPIHDYLSKLTRRTGVFGGSGGTGFFDDIDDILLESPVPQADAAAKLLARIDPETLPNTALRTYIKTQQGTLPA